jgi:hypothetical protein
MVLTVNAMQSRRALIMGGACVLFTLAPALAATAAPAPGGCRAFGNNVAFLANTAAPNGAFGTITSEWRLRGFPERGDYRAAGPVPARGLTA